VSQKDLEAVIGRAVLDREFRHLLFAEPEAALAEYVLTEDELAALKWGDAESLDACADIVAQRRARRPRNRSPGT
jgi:hypothetical protein